MSSQIKIIFSTGVYVPTKQTTEEINSGNYCGGCDFYDTNKCFKVECARLLDGFVYKIDVNLTRIEKLNRILNGEG